MAEKLSRRTAFACWSRPGGDRLRDDPGRGREEERLGRAAHDLEDDHLPDGGRAGKKKRSQRGLGREHRKVGADEDDIPAKPVRPDSADEKQQDLRNACGREDEAELGRRAVEVVEDGEREGDRRDCAAEQRRRAPEEEQAEVPLGERPQPGGEAHVVGAASVSRRLRQYLESPAYDCASGAASW